MSIWIWLWAFLSVFLLGFMGWTLFTLMRQKAAWKEFAKKYKLRYKPGKATMDAPEMQGVLADYKISFFPSEHESPDVRGTRSMTAVEVTLGSAPPTDGTVASGGMVPIAQSIGFKMEISPKREGWNKTYIAAADNRAVLSAYLTDKRLDALLRLMKVKDGWVMFIFRENVALLRFDTPRPLLSVQELEQVKDMLLAVAKVLELEKGELQKLKTEEARADSGVVSLEIEGDALDKAAAALTLEDDES